MTLTLAGEAFDATVLRALDNSNHLVDTVDPSTPHLNSCLEGLADNDH